MLKENKINKIFDLLDQWRKFPAYQLERRADIFFAIYLPKIVKEKFGLNEIKILPEFPVRVGSIYPSLSINKSFKIDYLVLCEKENRVLFVELKTDSFSRRTKQDEYLERAKILNVPGLVEGLLRIYDATVYNTKYRNYFNNLVEWGWMKNDGDRYSNVSHRYNIDTVYIQPNKKDNVKDIIISFDEIINYLEEYKDSLTNRFINSLVIWKRGPND